MLMKCLRFKTFEKHDSGRHWTRRSEAPLFGRVYVEKDIHLRSQNLNDDLIFIKQLWFIMYLKVWILLITQVEVSCAVFFEFR